MREISESHFMALPLLSFFSSLSQVRYVPSQGQVTGSRSIFAVMRALLGVAAEYEAR